MLCNNQSSFVSHTPIKLCHLLGIRYINSRAYRSQARGLVERLVRSIRSIIRKVLISDERINPQIASAIAVHIYDNSNSNTILALTPTQLHYGLSENQFPYLLNQEKSKHKSVRRTLNKAIHVCIDKVNRKKKVLLDRKNEHRANITFMVGDLVLVKARSTN